MPSPICASAPQRPIILVLLCYSVPSSVDILCFSLCVDQPDWEHKKAVALTRAHLPLRYLCVKRRKYAICNLDSYACLQVETFSFD